MPTDNAPANDATDLPALTEVIQSIDMQSDPQNGVSMTDANGDRVEYGYRPPAHK